MSIIADALKKAQRGENPNLRSETKSSKQPIFGPSSNNKHTKEIKKASSKKHNFLAGGLVFGILFVLALALILSYIQSMQKVYVEKPMPVTVTPVIQTTTSTPTPKITQKPFRLSGIVQDEDKPLAVINDKVVGVGEVVDEAKIVSIEGNLVNLKHKGRKITLYLEN